MNTDFSKIWQDLRRRRVFQVAAIYAAAAWIIVEVFSVVAPATNMPGWVMTAVVGLAMIGFPILAVLAWLFDVGRDGVVRTKPGSATGVLAIAVSFGLLVAGTTGFVWLIKPQQQASEQASEEGLQFDLIAGSIAVMPFVDLSPNRDFVHFADGISAVLIHQLSAIAKIKVIASDSSFALRDEGFEIRQIGQKLRAEKLLVGSVQRSDNSLRISTQLVDTRTGESVWSEVFDRESKDIFAIQDEIALTVAENITEPLAPETEDRVTHIITDDLDAYDFYLLGLHRARNTVIDHGYAEVIEYFEQAVALDPQLALAWAKLSSTVFWHGTRGFIPRDEAIRRSREYLAKAFEINPELSEAHSHASVLAGGVDRDLDAARSEFEKAIELSPSNWLAYLGFGITLTNFSRHAEAVDVLENALELQPYRPDPLLVANLGSAYVNAGMYEKGMRLLAVNYADRKGSETESQYIVWLAETARRSYQFADAIAAFEIALRDGFDSARSRSSLCSAYLVIGDIGSARKHVERAEELVAQQVAEGRSMNPEIGYTRLARMNLDIANNDVEGLLLRTKVYLSDAETHPDPGTASLGLYQGGLQSIILGRYADGAAAMEEFLLTAKDPENYALAVYAYSKLGDAEKAQKFAIEGRPIADEYLLDRSDSAKDLVLVALFFAMDERADEAISLLQRTYDMGYLDHGYLAYMPPFDPIRNDPRFSEILRAMRADTSKMRERVDSARAGGDWESLIARFN